MRARADGSGARALQLAEAASQAPSSATGRGALRGVFRLQMGKPGLSAGPLAGAGGQLSDGGRFGAVLKNDAWLHPAL